MSSDAHREPGLHRAWAWVDHLRAGGTTPWSDFTGSVDSRGSLLPGAIQLEVARRLNLVGGVDSAEHAALVDRVFETSGPGRGQPDLELVGVHTGSRFGPRPVDPAELPGDELIRMAVGLLADLVVAHEPGEPVVEKPRAALPWRRAYSLYGDPLAVSQVRTTLVRAGAAPGRRSPVAVILADDLAGMLADVWSWRVQHAVNPSWRWWLAGWARNDRLPRVLDLPSVAANQAARLGADRVHIVAAAHHVPLVAGLVGCRRPVDATRVGLSPEALDVVRHVNVVLRVLADPDRHQHLLRDVLLPWLADETGRRRVVPPRHLEWVRHRAMRMRDELRVAGYPVLGDLDALVPTDQPRAAGPTDDGVLDVALRTLLKVKEIDT
ncbi:hypothetical protein [Nocardioides sp. Root151]|uniref:hypothetical protein n=1 Tax=Nocardioides sp. Root151 TaxID=1736475 RepID=UPI00070336F1|nr:hypothetical protein [Nocardioides sp. Root151]KQZ76125.1 hypothetical protein ASD66_07575 [Nocardioides sp. Root151]